MVCSCNLYTVCNNEFRLDERLKWLLRKLQTKEENTSKIGSLG